MAIKLNLLPPELTVDKNLGVLLKTIKSLGVISLAVFLIFILVVSAIFVVSSINLKNLTANIDNLKSQIAAQEKSEQQIVFLKDRIGKIKTVQNLPTSVKSLALIDPLLPATSPDFSVGEFNIDLQKVQLLLNFRSSRDVSNFLKILTASGNFKSVLLTSLNLNPTSGYSVSINIETK